MGLGHRGTFRRCVQRHQGDAASKGFGCHDQWLAMAFAQLTFRESLRDLESSLHSRTALLYQMGFRSDIRRSTLADGTELRGWRIYAYWAKRLILSARFVVARRSLLQILYEDVSAWLNPQEPQSKTL